MHCSQPFCGTGHPFYGQFYPFSHSSQCQTYPEVIGEGDVASVVFPDGSIHLYFIPVTRRPSPLPYTPYLSNNCNQYGNSVGAYYIRSVSNPISPGMFSQQCQKMYGASCPRPCLFNGCNTGLAPPGFQLKFHNDIWTSTTDLHYFVPSIRQCEWFPLTQPKQSVAVQVPFNIPEKADSKQEAVCAKPCLCISEPQKKKKCSQKIVCLCAKTSSCSRSSTSSKRSRISSSSLKNNSRAKVKKHKQKSSTHGSSTLCECTKLKTADKSVTTCTEQATEASSEQERKTQTCTPRETCTTNLDKSKSGVSIELWLPKTCLGAEAMETKSSEKIVDIYESNKSSSLTCCCSTSDSDAHNAY